MPMGSIYVTTSEVLNISTYKILILYFSFLGDSLCALAATHRSVFGVLWIGAWLVSELLTAVDRSCYPYRESNSCFQSVVTQVCNSLFLGYPAIRHKCDAWFLTRRETHILGVSEKKMLKKILGLIRRVKEIVMKNLNLYNVYRNLLKWSIRKE